VLFLCDPCRDVRCIWWIIGKNVRTEAADIVAIRHQATTDEDTALRAVVSYRLG
jgi:hypothetical protein